MKVERPCAVCGKECQPWQRNEDGSYLHDGCAIQASTQPTIVLRSPGAKEDT